MLQRRTSFKRYSGIIFVMLISMVLAGGQVVRAQSDAEKQKAKLQERIKQLEAEKQKEQAKIIHESEASKPTGKSLAEVIDRYEKLLQGCKVKKSARCADVYATLASLYHDDAQDKFVAARNAYEKAMNDWEKTQRGAEPVNPLPDYSKSLNMYQSLIADYPEASKIDEAYYQIGAIYLVSGDIDKSKKAFEDCIAKVPNSPRASAAHFRLADFSWMDHDFNTTLKHLDAVKPEMVNIDINEMVQWRKADVHYNMGDFDQALQLYFGYIEACDNGQFKKCEFHDMSLEMLGVTFSDMGNGGEEAEKFFKKIGHRPYEDYVFYTIGMKNRVHGQYDDAIKSLQFALNKFPYYKDAPLAQQMLVECFLVKKEYDKANEARIKLVDEYGT
jgi:tetratricopeptide (TPR) repeat protein